jgi:hypothetical protein
VSLSLLPKESVLEFKKSKRKHDFQVNWSFSLQ